MDDLQNDITRYLRGELTPSEMHALEKQALDDPFLADALEGASQTGAANFSADVVALKDRLNRKMQKPEGHNRSVVHWSLRIAAGLVMIILSTFLILKFGDQESRDQKLAEQKPVSDEPQQSATVDSVTKPSPALDAPKAVEETLSNSAGKADTMHISTPEKAESVESAPVNDERINDHWIAEGADAATDLEEEKQEAEDITLSESPPEQKEENSITSSPAVTSPQLRNREAVKKESNGYNDKLKIIKGQVTEAGDPRGVPGVNVLIKGTSKGVITDSEGFYEIPVSETEPTLVFSFIGLESKEVKAETHDEVNVEMEQDVSQLSEVVVIGYGGEGNGEPEPYTFEMAEPAGGRKVYKQYLEQNMRYPEQALKNDIEGRVTVQFTVETDGSLSDFRVLKGLGYGCDEEIIRLIREGPAWSPSKRVREPVRDRVKVRLKFTLPKK